MWATRLKSVCGFFPLWGRHGLLISNDMWHAANIKSAKSRADLAYYNTVSRSLDYMSSSNEFSSYFLGSLLPAIAHLDWIRQTVEPEYIAWKPPRQTSFRTGIPAPSCSPKSHAFDLAVGSVSAKRSTTEPIRLVQQQSTVNAAPPPPFPRGMWETGVDRPVDFNGMLQQISSEVLEMEKDILPTGLQLDQIMSGEEKAIPRKGRQSSWLDMYGDPSDSDVDVEDAVEGVASIFGVHPRSVVALQVSIPVDTKRWSGEKAKTEVMRAATTHSESATLSTGKRGRRHAVGTSSDGSVSEPEGHNDSDWASKTFKRRMLRVPYTKSRTASTPGTGSSGTPTGGTAQRSPSLSNEILSTHSGDERRSVTPSGAISKTKRSRPLIPNVVPFSETQLEAEPAIKGVYFDRARKLWRANWKENGRVRTKGFSVAEHGNEQARDLACEHRLRMEHQHLRWNSSPATADASAGSHLHSFPIAADLQSFPFPTKGPVAVPVAPATSLTIFGSTMSSSPAKDVTASSVLAATELQDSLC
eukprot:Selendium_serpulae@DN5786_c0_g1_i1.p1